MPNETVSNESNRNRNTTKGSAKWWWLPVVFFLLCIMSLAHHVAASWGGGEEGRNGGDEDEVTSGRAARLRRAREQQGSCRIYRFSDSVSCYPSGCDTECPAKEAQEEGVNEIDTIARFESRSRRVSTRRSVSGSVSSSVSMDVCQLIKVNGVTTCEPENCSEECG